MNKEKKYKISAVLYGIMAIVCCFSFFSLYWFVLIFTCLSVFNAYFAYKHHKKNKARFEKEIKDYQEENNGNKRKKPISPLERAKNSNQKKLKLLYQKRLQEIEEDFSDVDFDKAMEEAEAAELGYDTDDDSFFHGYED